MKSWSHLFLTNGWDKKSGKKNKLVTEAGEGKPAAVLTSEEFYPGISQKISLEIKRKEQSYLSHRIKKHQSLETNLFNENMKFFFQDLVLTKEMYKKLLTRRLSLVGTLNVGCHLMHFLARCMKVSLQNLEGETCRQLLLATQKCEGCSVTKHKTRITKKVCVAEFCQEASNNVIGINYLPIVSNKSDLGMN